MPQACTGSRAHALCNQCRLIWPPGQMYFCATPWDSKHVRPWRNSLLPLCHKPVEWQKLDNRPGILPVKLKAVHACLLCQANPVLCPPQSKEQQMLVLMSLP